VTPITILPVDYVKLFCGWSIPPCSGARSFLNDPRHWRERAEEARSRADQIAEPQSKNAMLRIAHDYEVLAERAEARASGHSLKSD
jgi:hypothetical protein